VRMRLTRGICQDLQQLLATYTGLSSEVIGAIASGETDATVAIGGSGDDQVAEDKCRVCVRLNDGVVLCLRMPRSMLDSMTVAYVM
jgi:hypothetical protein